MIVTLIVIVRPRVLVCYCVNQVKAASVGLTPTASVKQSKSLL